MNDIQFDQAFSEFLDDNKCENVSEFVLELVRSAFTAGWKAAFSSDIGKVMNIDNRL